MRFRDSFLNFIKGAIIGIANIIPGVSGGTLAVSLGVYENMLDSIGNFFHNIKDNLKFLIPILLGAVLGILSASKLISFLLENYQLQTILFFIGLIVGGMSLVIRKVQTNVKTSNILIFFISFAIVFGINFLVSSSDVSLTNLGIFDCVKLLFVGALASGTMIIPGVSGSMVLMLIGYYNPIINVISNLTNFSDLGANLLILIPFGLGAILGIIGIAKLLTFLLKKYEIKTHYAILGFILASIAVLIMEIRPFDISFFNILTSLLACLWGFLLARNFDKE